MEEEVNRVKISGAKAIFVVLGSEGCRRRDGFPGTDRLLNSKGRSRLAFLMLLTNSTPRITLSNVERKRKFDREFEKYKHL